MSPLSLRNVTAVTLALGPLIVHSAPALTPPSSTPPEVVNSPGIPGTPSQPPPVAAIYPDVSAPHTFPSIDKRHIINGVDDRVRVNESDLLKYPYSAIGLIHWGGGEKDGGEKDYSPCTGFIVGPRHVATASHCYNASRPDVSFTPAYKGAKTNETYKVYKVVTATHPDSYIKPWKLKWTHCDWREDYVVLVLDNKAKEEGLAEKHGRFSVTTVDSIKNETDYERLRTAGYPTDLVAKGAKERRMYHEDGIKWNKTDVLCKPDGPLAINADSWFGQSGAPVWLDRPGGDAVALGVLATGNGYSTKVAAGSGFVDTVNWALKKYP